MRDYEKLSKRLATGEGSIGVKGIKPISGQFKAKKCVKTVSYRGRPRYICPASGGASAIRSLEKLPVKPEDVPRRLADIKQFSPEEQYTPKQQREEPKKIHEALFRKPQTIHYDDPKEAQADALHDHLHFTEPKEAEASKSDAIILKEDKKKSKKKSKGSGDDMDKSIYLRLDLFKGPPPPTKAASPPPTSVEYKVVSARREIPKKHLGTHGLEGKTHRSGFEITNDPGTRLFKTKDEADAALSRARELKIVELPSGKFGVSSDPKAKTFDSRDKARAHRFGVSDVRHHTTKAGEGLRTMEMKILGQSRPGRLPPTPRSKTFGEHLKYAAVNTALTVIPIGKVAQGFKVLVTGSKAALKAVQPAIKAAGGTIKMTPKGAVVTGGEPVKNVLMRSGGTGGGKAATSQATRRGASGGATTMPTPGDKLAEAAHGVGKQLKEGGKKLLGGGKKHGGKIVGSAGIGLGLGKLTGTGTETGTETGTKTQTKTQVRETQNKPGGKKRIPWDLSDDDDEEEKEKGIKPVKEKKDKDEKRRPFREKVKLKKKKSLDDVKAILRQAAEKHKEQKEDERYSEIGDKKDLKELLDEAKARATFGKSQSFVAPYARKVRNKKMSLKAALNKVPWWMQDDLLAHVRKDKKRK